MMTPQMRERAMEALVDILYRRRVEHERWGLLLDDRLPDPDALDEEGWTVIQAEIGHTELVIDEWDPHLAALQAPEPTADPSPPRYRTLIKPMASVKVQVPGSREATRLSLGIEPHRKIVVVFEGHPEPVGDDPC